MSYSGGGPLLHRNTVVAIRVRLRRGLSVKSVARTLGVSRNTIRRYASGRSDLRAPPRLGFNDSKQDIERGRRIAREFDTPDRDELESALIAKIASVRHKRTQTTNWPAFLARILRREALNWLRAERRRKRHVSLINDDPIAETSDDVPDRLDSHPSHLAEEHHDDSPLDAVRLMDPDLRSVWDAMLAEHLDQTQAARRLGVHRNTVRQALKRIRALLYQHGF